MGVYIEIKKIKTEKELLYYRVIPHDFKDVPEFSICIDPQKKTLYLYQNSDDKHISATIDLKKPSDPNLDWLPGGLIARILYKVIQALEKQDFGEYLSFCS